MKVQCHKELKIKVCNKQLIFQAGEIFDANTDKDGSCFIIKEGFKFKYSSYNRDFLKHFEIIDDEWEEQKKRLGI